jgi:hypothetical protein
MFHSCPGRKFYELIELHGQWVIFQLTIFEYLRLAENFSGLQIQTESPTVLSAGDHSEWDLRPARACQQAIRF